MSQPRLNTNHSCPECRAQSKVYARYKHKDADDTYTRYWECKNGHKFTTYIKLSYQEWLSPVYMDERLKELSKLKQQKESST